MASDIHVALGPNGIFDYRKLLVTDAGLLRVAVESISASASGATSATIYNVPLLLAATEYSQALPANTKQLILKARGAGAITLAYVLGDSGTLYMTIDAGASIELVDLNFTGVTLYMQTNVGGTVAEIQVLT